MAQAADKYLLKEKWEAGEQCQTTLSLQFNGEMQMRSDEKVLTLALGAQAEHRFPERVLSVDESCHPSRVARFYEQANATITVQGARSPRTLRPERRLQVAQRIKEQTVLYSPNGPLMRQELELTGDHLDVLMAPALLPEKEIAIGDTWEVGIPAVQALVGLDGIISHDVNGKLESVQGDVAQLSFAGDVEGISNGAEMKATVKASCSFHVKSQHITTLQWKQKEERQHGPISQHIKAESSTTMKRTFGAKSSELSDSVVNRLSAEPSATDLLLLYRDAKDRFEFLHERGWHLVGQTEQFTVMRLMERGELIGQVNIVPWPKDKPGQHISPEELQKLIELSANFTLDQVLQGGAAPAQKGNWAYRISAAGKSNETPMIQSFCAIAGPKGDQLLLIFATEASQAERLGDRDRAILATVTFPPGK
jgi:hypothetical protein